MMYVLCPLHPKSKTDYLGRLKGCQGKYSESDAFKGIVPVKMLQIEGGGGVPAVSSHHLIYSRDVSYFNKKLMKKIASMYPHGLT